MSFGVVASTMERVLALTGQPWATLLWALVPPESNAHSRMMGAGGLASSQGCPSQLGELAGAATLRPAQVSYSAKGSSHGHNG